ncbi:hypothetical protein RHS01_08523 [Rhizoctonia solani]|uniref:Chromo domain-containing protein n=1 Tax=Rhizoctonia solani TaxID=456999 RepID=A0A8H7LZ56_9AGAM|nr:hypothetical protein RHS01_08523 [Rhizoctonia solani]
MLPNPVFANTALVIPKKELQRQIKASLDQDESLEEILQFLQNESKAPPSIKRAFKDYKMEAGLLFYQGRIVVPDVGTLRTDLLRIFHDSPLAGHPGRQRTLELVSRTTTGPESARILTGMWTPAKRVKESGKPKYASIPLQPLELPRNSDSILVIVEASPNTSFWWNVPKTQSTGAGRPVLTNVWKQYGMPKRWYQIEERVFNNKFLKALYQRLGIDPHFSSAYHPQSDGQTERVNPTVKHFLRAYSGVTKKTGSTGKSPFKALYGWEPTLTPSNVPTDVPEANELAEAMESQWREVEAALQQSKSRMVAGKQGTINEQRLGPFKVTEKISNRAYRLELPPTMRIHNVFYVGLLSKVKRDSNRTFENRPPPITVDGEEEYKVEGITDAEERNGKWFFRVKWKGYGSEENTWEPQENLKNAEKILEKYEKEMKKKALGAAKALRGGQQTDNIFDHVTSALISYAKRRATSPPALISAHVATST